MTPPMADFRLITEACAAVRNLDGDAIELGVYRGMSAAWICDALAPTTVWLLDTFTGMPKPTHTLDGCHLGQFGETDVDVVRSAMGTRTNFRICPGLFADTLPQLTIDRLKFAHIDCDLHDSTEQAIEWVWPRLVAGGRVVCDDYHGACCRGATLALDRFRANRTDCEAIIGKAVRMVLIKTGGTHGN